MSIGLNALLERRTPPARGVRGALAAVLVEAAELRRRCGAQPRILVVTAGGNARPLTAARNRLVDVFMLGAGELLGVPATPWRVGAGCAVALGGTLDVWALRSVVVLCTGQIPTAFLATRAKGGFSDTLLIGRAPGASVVVRTLGARGHCAAFHRRAGVSRFSRVFAGLETAIVPRRALVATATTKMIWCPVTRSGAFAPPAAAHAGLEGCSTGNAL